MFPVPEMVSPMFAKEEQTNESLVFLF